jgi:phage gp36-like protein
VHHAVAIIRFRLLTRLDISVSEDRRLEYTDARRFFDQVAEGKREIELPEGLELDTGSPAETIEVISANAREVTRETLRGL